MRLEKDNLFGSRKSVGEAREYMLSVIVGLPSEHRASVLTGFMVFWNTIAEILEEEENEQEIVHGEDSPYGVGEKDW